jgi:hypothetical protein
MYMNYKQKLNVVKIKIYRNNSRTECPKLCTENNFVKGLLCYWYVSRTSYTSYVHLVMACTCVWDLKERRTRRPIFLVFQIHFVRCTCSVEEIDYIRSTSQGSHLQATDYNLSVTFFRTHLTLFFSLNFVRMKLVCFLCWCFSCLIRMNV